MNRNELYQMIVDRTIQCFTPTEHALQTVRLQRKRKLRIEKMKVCGIVKPE